MITDLVFQPVTKNQRVILYELNEVPWRVIDWYVKIRPNSTLAYLVSHSQLFKTYTPDEGELHPWTTWPTLHRGVSNTHHNIRFINQSLSEADFNYPPIWQRLCSKGVTVGVFGSLQSYPPLSHPGFLFYIPDTFSPSPLSYPTKYQHFQSFNLRQTSLDSAIPSSVSLSPRLLSEVFNLLRTGLRFKSLLRLVFHLLKEKLDPIHKSRRSVLQTIVSFDIFKNALCSSSPQFTTFFTNHVAGMMHRYWKQTFPEDFAYSLSSSFDLFHSRSILYAMDIADDNLSWLVKYVNKHNSRLLIASSMGQEAIDRGNYEGEWRIVCSDTFLSALNWNKPVQAVLAMQPDFNFHFESSDDAVEFISVVSQLVDSSGRSIWKRVNQLSSTVNLALAPSEEALKNNLILRHYVNTSTTKSISDFGIKKIFRDQGTGYHCSEGMLLHYGNDLEPSDTTSIQTLCTTSIADAIFNMFS